MRLFGNAVLMFAGLISAAAIWTYFGEKQEGNLHGLFKGTMAAFLLVLAAAAAIIGFIVKLAA